MRFGAFIPQGWRHDLVGIDRDGHWPAMTGVASAAEAAGFDSVWVYDHFHPVPEPTQEPVYEAWTLMAALAVATERVRLGQMCTCAAYRPPAYLAKVAASIDVISGGRLEMGIGAGWYEHEFDGYGYPFPKPSARIGLLAETVEVMRRMWTEDEVHFDGRFVTLQGALCRPKPLQEPHIPLWIAGAGEQLTLRVVAEHGNYANFGGDVETFRHKRSVLEEHCRTVGRDPADITLSRNFNVIIGETQAEVDERLDWYRSHLSPLLGEERTERMIHTNYVASGGLIGTPEQLVERIAEYRQEGLDYAILYFQEAAYDRSGIELFARDVIPALR
jgi:F420-dependent oxidoreductase-like protein